MGRWGLRKTQDKYGKKKVHKDGSYEKPSLSTVARLQRQLDERHDQKVKTQGQPTTRSVSIEDMMSLIKHSIRTASSLRADPIFILFTLLMLSNTVASIASAVNEGDQVDDASSPMLYGDPIAGLTAQDCFVNLGDEPPGTDSVRDTLIRYSHKTVKGRPVGLLEKPNHNKKMSRRAKRQKSNPKKELPAIEDLPSLDQIRREQFDASHSLFVKIRNQLSDINVQALFKIRTALEKAYFSGDNEQIAEWMDQLKQETESIVRFFNENFSNRHTLLAKFKRLSDKDQLIIFEYIKTIFGATEYEHNAKLNAFSSTVNGLRSVFIYPTDFESNPRSEPSLINIMAELGRKLNLVVWEMDARSKYESSALVFLDIRAATRIFYDVIGREPLTEYELFELVMHEDESEILGKLYGYDSQSINHYVSCEIQRQNVKLEAISATLKRYRIKADDSLVENIYILFDRVEENGNKIKVKFNNAIDSYIAADLKKLDVATAQMQELSQDLTMAVFETRKLHPEPQHEYISCDESVFQSGLLEVELSYAWFVYGHSELSEAQEEICKTLRN